MAEHVGWLAYRDGVMDSDPFIKRAHGPITEGDKKAGYRAENVYTLTEEEIQFLEMMKHGVPIVF